MLHALLKEHTRAAHEALHRHPLLRPLGEGTLTRHDCAAALQAFALFYRHYEPQAAVWCGFDGAPVLRWLDADPLLAAHSPAPAIKYGPKPEIHDRASWLGYLYVKQGSTLGGQVISKRLRRQLGLEAGRDQRFFHGYGEQTGERWKAFLAYLAAEENDVEPHRVVQSAHGFFAGLHHSCDALMQEGR